MTMIILFILISAIGILGLCVFFLGRTIRRKRQRALEPDLSAIRPTDPNNDTSVSLPMPRANAPRRDAGIHVSAPYPITGTLPPRIPLGTLPSEAPTQRNDVIRAANTAGWLVESPVPSYTTTEETL